MRGGEQLRLPGGVPPASWHCRIVFCHAGSQFYHRHNCAREARGRYPAYVMGPVLGPTIDPIIGGSLTPAASWRWRF